MSSRRGRGSAPLSLDEDAVRELLGFDEAVQAVDRGFRLMAHGHAVNVPRSRGVLGHGVLNVMAAMAPTTGFMGAKIYSVAGGDAAPRSSFLFMLYGMDVASPPLDATHAPRRSGRGDSNLAAIIEADVLGQRRTGATSAVASLHLARPDSEVLGVIGTGWQSQAQILATLVTQPSIRRVLVAGRSRERAEAHAKEIELSTGVTTRASSVEHLVRQADVLVTVTGSSTPVFDGSWVAPGTHINAVGAVYPNRREIDADTVRRADVVVTDSSEAARQDCGDLLLNEFDWARLIDLGDVVVGRSRGRETPEQITLFENQGLAVHDLLCAVHVFTRAQGGGLGSS